MGNIRYGFGDLNPVADHQSSVKNKKNLAQLSDYAIMREGAYKSLENEVVFGQNGRFRAVVLRVEKPNQDMPFDNGLQIVAADGANSLLKNLVRIKARIPEIHCGIPEPEIFNSAEGPHQRLIEMHHTFVAENEKVPVPAINDIVWVSFGNLKTLTDPIYHGLANEFGRIAQGADTTTSAKGTFKGCSAALPSAPVQSKVVDVSGFKDSTYVSGSHIVLDKQQIKTPFPVEHKDASAVFGVRPRKEKVQRIILHHSGGGSATGTFRTLVRRELGTHFEVDQSGMVWQYLDPAVYVTFHAGKFNSNSIGIDFTGPSPDFSDIQMSRMADLILVLCKHFKIPPVPQVDYLPHNPKDQIDSGGVFGHVHWTDSGKWDPAGPLVKGPNPERWRQLKRILDERSSLSTEYVKEIVKLNNSKTTIVAQSAPEKGKSSPCVGTVGKPA